MHFFSHRLRTKPKESLDSTPPLTRGKLIHLKQNIWRKSLCFGLSYPHVNPTHIQHTCCGIWEHLRVKRTVTLQVTGILIRACSHNTLSKNTHNTSTPKNVFTSDRAGSENHCIGTVRMPKIDSKGPLSWPLPPHFLWQTRSISFWIAFKWNMAHAMR